MTYSNSIDPEASEALQIRMGDATMEFRNREEWTEYVRQRRESDKLIWESVKRSPYIELTYEKETTVEQTVEQLIRAKQQEKEVTRRLAWIEAQGDDDHPDGTIVRFEKKHNKKLYTYAAIKAAGFWYTTSGAGIAAKYCWPDFLLWLSEDNPEPQVIVQINVTVWSEK